MIAHTVAQNGCRSSRMFAPFFLLWATLFLPSLVSGAPPMPPVMCDTVNGECAPIQGVNGMGVKWNPGIYLRQQGARVPFMAADYFALIDGIAEIPNILGIKVHVYWGSLEGPTPGSYDFRELRALYNYLESRNLRLAVHLQTRNFSADCSNVVPSYLASSGTSLNEKGSTCLALLWNPEIMDHYIALVQALGEEFDSASHFEALMFTETATGAPFPSSAGYSATSYLAQLKRLIGSASQSWPATNKVVYFNFMNGATDAQKIDLYKHMFDYGIAFGGPDIFPTVPGEAHGDVHKDTEGMSIRKGKLGGVDYRFDVAGNYLHAAIMDIQPPEMGGYKGNWTPLELIREAWHHSATSHLFITKKDWQADPLTSEPDCANWAPPSGSFEACQIGFKAFIRQGLAVPPERNQQCPASYAQGCR